MRVRCDVPARAIANALRDICKKILIERSLAQSSSRMGIHANNRLRYVANITKENFVSELPPTLYFHHLLGAL